MDEYRYKNEYNTQGNPARHAREPQEGRPDAGADAETDFRPSGTHRALPPISPGLLVNNCAALSRTLTKLAQSTYAFANWV